METNRLLTVLAFSLVLCMGVFALPERAAAQEDGFGQYLVAVAYDDARVMNPTGIDMYTCAINYSSSGNFSSCECDLLASKATRFLGSSSGHIQVISVPVSGKDAGRINTRFGVFAQCQKAPMASRTAADFELHPNSTQRANMLADCCGDISNDGQPNNIFRNFDGFICP